MVVSCSKPAWWKTRAEVERGVGTATGGHQVAGRHEDARVVGVPEERSQDELDGDAQGEEAPVVGGGRRRGRHVPAAVIRRA